jgi:hypothetical protein
MATTEDGESTTEVLDFMVEAVHDAGVEIDRKNRLEIQ